MLLLQNSYLSHRSGEHGFTLIEVLLAVTILAIVSSVMYSSLFGSLDAMDTTREKMDLYEKARLVFTLMEADFQGAYRSEVTDYYIFKGVDNQNQDMDNDRVIFISTSHKRMIPDAKELELCEVEYSLLFSDRGDEPVTLMRRTDPTPDREPESGGITFVLLENIAGMNVEYFNGREWVPDWNAKGKGMNLPKVIRIELVFLDNHGEEQSFSNWISVPTS